MEVKKQKPPGKKLLKNMSLYTKWLLSTIGGLFLISIGLYFFGEASNLKHENAPFMRWLLLGIYSFVLLNVGLGIFAQSIVLRVRMKNKKLIKKALKERAKRSAKKLTITKLDTPKAEE